MIDHDLVFDALVLPHHLPVLSDFAELYPELRMVVDHAAKPPLRSGDLSEWRHDMTTIARGTHAVCKLSGLVTEAGSANPAILAPCVDHLLEAFGPRRLMWGSDWPVCELVCSYDEWSQASDMLLVRLAPSERAQIYSATARETYGI
jgi:L-fuconolactonase